MFAKRVEGRHSCDFVHILSAVEKSRLLNDFVVIFFTGGVRLEPAERDWMTWWGRRLIFFMFFNCPGGVFWHPCGRFGRP